MIQYSYTLWNDHYSKSSYHPSPHNVTSFFLVLRSFKLSKQLLGVQCSISYGHHAMRHISMTYLFITGSLYLLILSTHFTHSPNTPHNLFSVSMSFVLFVHFVLFFRFHIEWNHAVFVFLWLWLITFNILLASSSDHVVVKSNFVLFLR